MNFIFKDIKTLMSVPVPSSVFCQVSRKPSCHVSLPLYRFLSALSVPLEAERRLRTGLERPLSLSSCGNSSERSWIRSRERGRVFRSCMRREGAGARAPVRPQHHAKRMTHTRTGDRRVVGCGSFTCPFFAISGDLTCVVVLGTRRQCRARILGTHLC